MKRAGTLGVVALVLVPLMSQCLQAQGKQPAKPRATLDSAAREDSAAKAFLEADERAYERRLLAQRTAYLKGAAWADLGDRCHPGALRIFPKALTFAQRDTLQQLVEHMEQTIIARGVGARLDTPDARRLLRTIVGWEAGIDRPLWDVDTKTSREAVATGLTGDVPDPRSNGCLPSPLAADTVTFVVPGFATMDFPKSPRPRVKAYFGPDAQRHARDEFFSTRGQQDPQAELSYILVAPMVLWRGWALVGVNRPREKGGVEIGVSSNGGAVYMMRQVGTQWRLVTVVRSWGS
ncbi:MAG: hypothetical protein IPP90_01670 [Gemmatimonadaceae bacterium]|nr:hypothetical protein [Gemmatimonadaceae bacterium]